MLMSESVEITGVSLCPGSGYATRCVTKQGLTRCLSLALTRNGLPYVEAFTELPGCNNQMKDIYAADQYILKLCGLQEDSIGREMRLQCSDYRSVLLAHVTSAEIVVDQNANAGVAAATRAVHCGGSCEGDHADAGPWAPDPRLINIGVAYPFHMRCFDRDEKEQYKELTFFDEIGALSNTV
jgi:hypothetical protein